MKCTKNPPESILTEVRVKEVRTDAVFRFRVSTDITPKKLMTRSEREASVKATGGLI